VQSHIAECEDEGRWLGSGDGAFMEFLAHLGIATPPVRPSWSEFISILTECKRAGIVHSTELPVESWQHSSANVICVYCPRTHAILSQTPHPFPELVKRGIPICLGTDSLASNPDLDPLAEGIFLKRRHPWLQGADLLDMLTTNGAQLLGFDHWVGRLAPSFSADCVVLPYIGNGSNDPYDQLFDSRQLNAARGVMLGGEWHYVPAALKSFILTHSAKGR
jgi:cytosine/adenosine deaminase-related metal-dependent hydrolase